MHRELLARDVRHEIVRLRAQVASADDLPRIMGLSDGCAAVRCYRLGGGPGLVAVLVRAGTTPGTAALLPALRAAGLDVGPSSDPRSATPAEINLATDFAAGLVSPVGLPADVPLIVDARLAARHVLYTAVGEGGVALGIRARDLLAVTGAHVAALDVEVVLPGRADADAGPAVIDLADRPSDARPR